MNLEHLTTAHAAVGKARAFTGDMYTSGYSPETEQRVIAERRDTLTSKAVATYQETLNSAARNVFAHAQQAHAATVDAWRNPTDLEAGVVMDRRHRWERIAERLDNGDSLGSIIATADTRDLAAIGEWGTNRATVDMLRRYGNLSERLTGDDPQRVVCDMLTARMAELNTTGIDAAAVTAARDALIVDTYRADPNAEGSLQGTMRREYIATASPFDVLNDYRQNTPTIAEDYQQ